LSETAVTHPNEKAFVPTAIIAIAAWLVPGLGHVLLRRWGRGVVFFVGVGCLAYTGAHLRGIVFPLHLGTYSSDPLAFLGGIGDAGSGMFYWMARFIEKAGPDVSRAAGDYGTKFIAAAGVSNYLCVVDAIEIARGRKD
jgi:uncharacterized protein DUF6677